MRTSGGSGKLQPLTHVEVQVQVQVQPKLDLIEGAREQSPGRLEHNHHCCTRSASAFCPLRELLLQTLSVLYGQLSLDHVANVAKREALIGGLPSRGLHKYGTLSPSSKASRRHGRGGEKKLRYLEVLDYRIGPACRSCLLPPYRSASG